MTKLDETIKERLERFNPRALTASSWANARGAAVDAVLASSPSNDTRAVCLVSRLCAFLAWHPSWAGDVAPDLAALLTPASIDTFVAERLRRGEHGGSVGVYRTDLRHIARAIGTMAPVAPSGRTRTCAPGVAFWSVVVDDGPFTALVAAYETKGVRFEAKSWDGTGDLSSDLAVVLSPSDRVTAGSDGLTTIAAVRSAAARLRTAADAEVARAVPASAPSGRTANAPRPPARRVSPTRAARAARAACAAAQGRQNEPAQSGLAEIPPSATELAAAVETWRPRKIAAARWAQVEATTRLLIRAFGPPSRTWLSSQAGYLARFCVWVASCPERDDRDADLRPDEVLDLSLVERFLADAMADQPGASRSTARSVLRRAVQNLSAAPKPERIPHAPVQAPYTPQECAAFVRLARNQPTRARRRAHGAIVALGLGAGLNGTEQGKVTPRHIVEVDLGEHGRALGVNVPGPRARLVIVRACYEELLREVLAIHRAERRGEDRPLYGNDPKRRNVTGAARTQAVTANDQDVELSASRLRSTWLVAAMSAPVPLGALLGAAGLRSARTLVDLVPYCPAPHTDRRRSPAANSRGPGSKCLDEARDGSAVIRRCTLDRTLDAVRRTGIHRDLEATLNPSGTGRPRQLKVDVFLAGVLLTVGDKRPLTLVNVHATLTENLALSARIALGTEYRPSPDADPRSLSIRQVRYLLEAIERKLAYTEGRRPDLASEDRDARTQALQHVLDKIIDASLPEHLPRPASIALDGTGLESWARGKKRSTGAASAAPDPATGKTSTGPEEHGLDAIGGEGYSFDPDARWGYRTRTYDNKSTRCFGYELYNLVGVPEVGEDPSALPKLTYALTLRPLATDVVEPGLALLDHLIARGHDVRVVVNDRAWSYMSAERWADELRRRGIDQVFDLHPADRGIRDFEGIAMIDGAPHCRAVLEDQAARQDMTVDELAVINRPTKLVLGPTRKRASAEELANQEKAKRELDELNAKIAVRRLAAFRRVQNARPTAKDQGKERWECPAQAGKVVCANCPASALLPEGTPKVEHPPAEATAPTCCTQRTVTIPGTVTPKLRQTQYWGSPEWIESYARRTYVEGFFGNMKNPSTENVRRGWCRVVGIVKTSILAACAVAATNIRLLRSWAEGRDFTDPLCAPNDSDHGFEELTAAASAAVRDRLLPSRAGPPQPAAA